MKFHPSPDCILCKLKFNKKLYFFSMISNGLEVSSTIHARFWSLLASPRVATGGLTDMGKAKTLHKKLVYHRQAKLSSAIGWHV